MKIQYCSDLHLEFTENSRFLHENPILKKGEILILAGDIAPLSKDYFHHPFFVDACNRFEKVYWLPGNHEFYGRDMKDFAGEFEIKVTENFSVLNNKVIQVGDVSLIFSTMWSPISPKNEKTVAWALADYSQITLNDNFLKTSDVNQIHDDSLAFLRKALQTPGKKVVVTHHLPSNQCNKLEHIGSPINEAFCVELSDFVEESGANFWIHGHSHYNHNPVYLGRTVLLSNQLGYVSAGEHSTFSRKALLAL